MSIKYRVEEGRNGYLIHCTCCKSETFLGGETYKNWKFCPSCGIMWDGGFTIDHDKREARESIRRNTIKNTNWAIYYTEKDNAKPKLLKTLMANSAQVWKELKRYKQENQNLTFTAEIKKNKEKEKATKSYGGIE